MFHRMKISYQSLINSCNLHRGRCCSSPEDRLWMESSSWEPLFLHVSKIQADIWGTLLVLQPYSLQWICGIYCLSRPKSIGCVTDAHRPFLLLLKTWLADLVLSNGFGRDESLMVIWCTELVEYMKPGFMNTQHVHVLHWLKSEPHELYLSVQASPVFM